MESVALAQLSWRLQRLHSVSAPARLRRTGLERALAGARARRAHVVPLLPQHERLLLGSRRLAATAAAIFLLAYGTYVASADSLPDNPLYQVKLLVEDARVAVAPPDEKPLLYVEQATRRLEETDVLISDGRISAAERTASDAARRIESARTAAASAPDAPAPQVREAIGSATAQYRSVSESLVSRGGSPPPVTGLQPSTVARPASALPVETTAAPDGEAAAELAFAPVDAVSAPGGAAQFLPVESAPSAPAATSAPVARVSAPSSTGFVGIDPTSGTRVSAPAASDLVPIETQTSTPRPTASSTARPASPTPSPGAGAATTPTSRPSSTPSPAPGATPQASATPGVGAPQVGFTPIPGTDAAPDSSRQAPSSGRDVLGGSRG
jgi:hypothetical protein